MFKTKSCPSNNQTTFEVAQQYVCKQGIEIAQEWKLGKFFFVP